MRNRSEDYHEVVEKIIEDPLSYDGWSASADEREVDEIKNIINQIAWSENDD